MAKRRAAEPLTYRVPWKRLLLRDLPEEPPLWVPPSGAARPGKRRVDAGTMAEPAAAPRKRRGGGDVGAEPRSRTGETGEPPPRADQQPLDGRAPDGGGGDGGAGSAGGAGGAPSQHNEEFWQYNTFQYWRNPLPPIDLADIEDVSADSLTETALEDKNEGFETEMES
uniref:RIKEN cDNA D030056L22 gene n=1 Tax=Nannospalax galili TaxID=1026970 RepID=A0A8C6R598_NANGA